ncbi:MAG: hypothetical protein EA376_09405 [Phycisphaeraceae bacterium]|nr:MAG: hypothetical protein EA376_09405 [Phycisphaeraceae bacterium]
MITYTLILQTVGSLTGVATSTSLIIAYRHLRLVNRNSQIAFEDALSREFRQVVNRLPLRALLGESLTDAELSASLTSFYWYFDLTNEQVFLRRHGRVSALTWRNWSEGVERTMRRPAFARAWSELDAGAVGVFNDLRRFVDEGFGADPIEWRSSRARGGSKDSAGLSRSPVRTRQSVRLGRRLSGSIPLAPWRRRSRG